MGEPPTIEISAGALEPSLPRPVPVRSRRPRSVLPWVTLLLLGGIGAKLWLDGRSSRGVPALASSGSAGPPPAPAAASPEPVASSASGGSASANVAPQTPPIVPSLPAAAPSGAHGALPRKIGP